MPAHRKAREVSELERKALDRVVRFFGSQAATARALSVTVPAINKWMRHGVPAERVAQLANATGIPKSHLRPDLYGRVARQ